MNKLILVTLLVSGLALCNASGENVHRATSKSDDILAALYFKPAEGDIYDNGWGGEYQTRAWLNENIGAAISIGLASWKVDARDLEIGDDGAELIRELDGDIAIVPIGGSLLLRTPVDDKIALTLEGGLRYAAVDADADQKITIRQGSETVYTEKTGLDADNGVVAIVGLTLESAVGKAASLILGVGYQFDVAKGFAKVGDVYLGRNELKSFTVRVGIAF